MVGIGKKNKKKGSLGISVKLVALVFALFYSILLVVNFKMFGNVSSLTSPSQNSDARGAPTASLATDSRSEFCKSLDGAVSQGTQGRPMIHAFVSNSGHFPFLHNVLLSMIRNGMAWTPLVLSIGEGVCPMLANVTELRGHVLCVPYLERLFHQLQRDEPESVDQIQKKLMPHNNTSHSNSHNRFHGIDNTFFGWGGIEHKFLINSKLYALRDILECGADAFITDTDIAFRKDPRPFFAISGPEGDIIAQDDTSKAYELSINSGFMYWKNTPQNFEVIEDVIKVPPFWHIGQSRVNTRMHNHSTPHTLLDKYRFPNGHMFLEHFDMLTDIVVFHANWNDSRDKKVGMLQKAGLWYLDTVSLDKKLKLGI